MKVVMSEKTINNGYGEWKEVRIGDKHIDLISGFAFKSKNFLEYQKEGSLPVIKIKNVANGDVNLEKVVYHKFDDSLEKYKVSYGDVLIAMTGNHPQAITQVVGNVSKYKLKTEALLNQRVGKIISKGENDLNFFYYFFKNEETHRYLSNNSSGSANQANISKNDILGLISKIPEPIEQKAIAEVLSSLDDKIDLLHRQNKTLEEMAQTLFRQWFVEEAKEDWEETTLGEVIEIFDSKRIPLSKIQRNKMKEGKLYPYYGAVSVMDYVNDYIFDGEFILLGEDGTVRTDEGYPVLQYATGKFWVNNHTHILKAKPPYNNFFIWNFLSKKNIDRIVTGAVQPKINQTNLKSLEFPVYPKELVNEYIEITNSHFDKINKNKSQIRTLEKLRDTLLPKLISGEVRVRAKKFSTQ